MSKFTVFRVVWKVPESRGVIFPDEELEKLANQLKGMVVKNAKGDEVGVVINSFYFGNGKIVYDCDCLTEEIEPEKNVWTADRSQITTIEDSLKKMDKKKKCKK